MRSGYAQLPKNTRRTAKVIIYPFGVGWLDVISNVAVGTDISKYVTRCQHTDNSADITVSTTNLNFRATQIVELWANDIIVWRGQITEIRSWVAQRGATNQTLSARSRNDTPLWRDIHYSTDTYPVGVQLTSIMRDVLNYINAQYELPSTGTQVPHSNVQFADMAVWDMLVQLCVPMCIHPFIDCYGQFKTYNMMAGLLPDAQIPLNLVVSLDGSNSATPITSVRLKWMSPDLVKTVQQNQVLYRLSAYPNPLEIRQVRRVFYSDDRTQRGQDTYMVKIRSVNNPLIKSITDIAMEITKIVNLLLLGPLMGGKINDFMISPYATEHWYPNENDDYGGQFIVTLSILKPIATIVGIIFWFVALIAMLSLQEGEYEIWGKPYDYVFPINTYEAYDKNTPYWALNVLEIESDLIVNGANAGTVTVHELLWQFYSSFKCNVTMVDHPGVEVGDILELEDGTRIRVESYSRDLTRGVVALLQIQGFRC